MKQNMTDPLRRKLALTSFNSHLTKLKKEGRLKSTAVLPNKECFELGERFMDFVI